jgi:hypothetical protein
MSTRSILCLIPQIRINIWLYLPQLLQQLFRAPVDFLQLCLDFGIGFNGFDEVLDFSVALVAVVVKYWLYGWLLERSTFEMREGIRWDELGGCVPCQVVRYAMEGSRDTHHFVPPGKEGTRCSCYPAY